MNSAANSRNEITNKVDKKQLTQLELATKRDEGRGRVDWPFILDCSTLIWQDWRYKYRISLQTCSLSRMWIRELEWNTNAIPRNMYFRYRINGIGINFTVKWWIRTKKFNSEIFRFFLGFFIPIFVRFDFDLNDFWCSIRMRVKQKEIPAQITKKQTIDCEGERNGDISFRVLLIETKVFLLCKLNQCDRQLCERSREWNRFSKRICMYSIV